MLSRQRWLILSLLFLIATTQFSVMRVSAACVINGTVFRDFNGDGIQNALEPGVPQADLVAVSPARDAYRAVSNANGTYSITGIPDNIIVRVQIRLPDVLDNGVVGVGGGASDSSVQFVTCGTNTTLNGVNFAGANPAQFCQPNPDVATSCYLFGDQLTGINSNRTAVLTIPYESGTTAFPATVAGARAVVETSEALANQVGAVWGTTYQPSTDTIYMASFIKRHVGLGPTGNPGTVYRIDRRTNTVEPYLTMSAGGDPHTPTNVTVIPPQPAYFDDIGAFNAVGNVGLGDIDIDDARSTMYVINLYYRIMSVITMGNPAGARPISAAGVDLPLNLPGAVRGCAENYVRPGALKIYDEKVYIGLTCVGPTIPDLRAYVYSYNGAFSTAPVAEFALNYPRGCATANGACTVAPAPSNDNPAAWQPWVIDVDNNPNNDLTTGPAFGQTYRPQPWLLDIEFDEYGFMIANVADRAGYQLGNDNATGQGSGPGEGVSAGDLLRLAPGTTSGTIGRFILENNGSVGVVGQPGQAISLGAGNNQGPGGGEFFYQENFGGTHQEISLGGVSVYYGTGEVINTVFDPATTPFLDAILSSGITMTNTQTGRRARSIEIIPQNDPGSFGKAAGLGDVEVLCGPSPLEIGNRVWLDTDKDGFQGADEAPIGGVTVRLYLDQNRDGVPDGGALATAITDAQGRYLFRGSRTTSVLADSFSVGGFSDADPTDAVGIVAQFYDISNATSDPRFATNPAARQNNEPRGIMPNTNYVIRLDNPTDYQVGGPLENLFLTLTQSPDPTGDPTIDNNGFNGSPQLVANGTNNIPIGLVFTGSFGEHDHTFDFGFNPTPPPFTPTTIVGVPSDVATATEEPSVLAEAFFLPDTGEVPVYHTMVWGMTSLFSAFIAYVGWIMRR
jgi:hypothetical protein